MTIQRLALATLLLTPTLLPSQTIVTGPGTQFSNASPSNVSDPSCVAALNTWCARNVRDGGAVGITAALPRNGNGSIQFSGPANAKADFEYYFAASGGTGNGIKLKDLSALSFDWYRSSASTSSAWFAPAIRLVLFNGGNFQGSLVYEPGLNGPTKNVTFALPTDNWVTESVAPGGFFWSTREGTQLGYSLTDWSSTTGRSGSNYAINGETEVVGFSVGIGSGWNGSFDGAVDNISYRTSQMEVAQSFNFETNVVPEPSTYALMGAGLLGLFAVQRRRRRA